MAKHCVDCSSKVGGLFFGRSYSSCDDCGENVCTSCVIEKDDTKRCTGCHRRSQSGGGGCFIATACYGINSNEVMVLRAWRDNTLLGTRFGRQFIDIYYRISPAIAEFIRDKPVLKRTVRFFLKPIIWFISII